MTDDDITVRYEGEEVIDFTVLHASKRIKTVLSRCASPHTSPEGEGGKQPEQQEMELKST